MNRTMRVTRGKTGGRIPKERKTFTLSRESVALLNDLRKARRGSRPRSVSAVLDDLLRALDKRRKQEAVEQAITSFYDGSSEQTQAEEREWGEFSLAQFLEGPG